MKKYLMIFFCLLAGTLFLTSCDKDDDDKGKPVVKIEEKANQLILSAKGADGVSMTITVNFDEQGITKDAKMVTVFPSKKEAQEEWADIQKYNREEIRKYTYDEDKTITYDMFEDYAKMNKAEVRRCLEEMKKDIENPDDYAKGGPTLK